MTFPLEKSGMDTAHSGKHNKRVGKLIASKAGATLEATRSARHDGKFKGVKRESKRGGSGQAGRAGSIAGAVASGTGTLQS